MPLAEITETRNAIGPYNWNKACYRPDNLNKACYWPRYLKQGLLLARQLKQGMPLTKRTETRHAIDRENWNKECYWPRELKQGTLLAERNETRNAIGRDKWNTECYVLVRYLKQGMLFDGHNFPAAGVAGCLAELEPSAREEESRLSCNRSRVTF